MTVCVEVTLLQVEDKDIQLALRGDLGVKLAQRAGCRVTRVCHQGKPISLAPGVDALKDCAGHKDLAAHGEREGLAEAQRDGVDGAQVGSHVLADLTVAARCALNKYSVFVF